RAERGPWATHATGALRGAAEGSVAPGCDARAEREGFPQENLVAQRWEGTTMTRTRPMTPGAAATLLIGLTTATADYHTNPELKPSSRCGTALQKNPLPDPGNIESLENYTTDCQPLYWDRPATVLLHVPVRAEYDRITGFLHGRIDRPPPLYTDGVDGFDEPGLGLTQLCPDVPDPVTGGIDHMIPWWAPAGQDTDGTNRYTGECRRGVRVHYGPGQVGTDPKSYDLGAESIVRVDNTEQLNDDNDA